MTDLKYPGAIGEAKPTINFRYLKSTPPNEDTPPVRAPLVGALTNYTREFEIDPTVIPSPLSKEATEELSRRVEEHLQKEEKRIRKSCESTP